MNIYTKLQCFFTVFLLCFVNLGYNAKLLKTLGLNEGDICLKGNVETPNYICRNITNYPAAMERMKNNEVSQSICSYQGESPIVCCPAEHFSATEMCEEYKNLVYFKKKSGIPHSDDGEDVTYAKCYNAVPLIANGKKAAPYQFPHMVLLGYSEKPDNEYWFCGGTLISKICVLTAAHCEHKCCEKKSNKLKTANWARLGELDYSTKKDIANVTDYKIVQRIIHPNYTSTSLYNDIALFRLEKDVQFSEFVRPICLNTDTNLRPPKITVAGWGRKGNNAMSSTHLLQTEINTILATECDNYYLNTPNRNISIAQGIVDSLMLCTSDSGTGKDICQGDSGGPAQIKHGNHICMYSQIGISSFGKTFCGENSISVYTGVSNYIPWIERIVWPKL